MSESWFIDPSLRDYTLDERGRPVIDETLNTPAYIRLTAPRGNWLYAPNKKYGSDFFNTRIKRTLNNFATGAAIARRALQPLIDNKDAISIAIVSTKNTRYALEFSATIVDNVGNENNIVLNPVGI